MPVSTVITLLISSVNAFAAIMAAYAALRRAGQSKDHNGNGVNNATSA